MPIPFKIVTESTITHFFIPVTNLKKNSWSPPLVVSGLGQDISIVILDQRLKQNKNEEIDAESNKTMSMFAVDKLAKSNFQNIIQ